MSEPLTRATVEELLDALIAENEDGQNAELIALAEGWLRQEEALARAEAFISHMDMTYRYEEWCGPGFAPRPQAEKPRACCDQCGKPAWCRMTDRRGFICEECRAESAGTEEAEPVSEHVGKLEIPFKHWEEA